MDDLTRLQEEMRRFFAALWPGQDKTLVFGEGQAHMPPLMLVGEAPGEQETLQGRPFVGKAGKNLDGFLAAVGLERPRIFITNVVKVRPVKVSPKGSVSNRPPNREELALFTPFLMRETHIVEPGMIVTLGNVPLKAFMGREAVIGACHGTEQKCSVGEKGQAFRLFPLYHPASIIYNRELKDVYAADLEKLRAVLDRDGRVI